MATVKKGMTSHLGRITVYSSIFGHPSRKHLRIIRHKTLAEKLKKV